MNFIRSVYSMHNYHRKKESKHEVQRRQEQSEKCSEKASFYPVIGKDILWTAGTHSGYEALQEPKPADASRDSGEGGGMTDDSCAESRSFRFMYMNWQPLIAKESTKGSLYMVKAFTSAAADASGEGSAGRGMVTIRLRGQGFLMNQIRLMISAALLYARGVVPLDLIRLSLDTPYRFSFPLAPAEGLLLVDSGYARNISGQNYSLHPHLEEQMTDLDMLTLMTASEYKTSEEFKTNSIYPEIHQDWNGSDSNELSSR